MRIKVSCYSGYRGEETPRQLWFGRRGVDVVEVLDRWLAPDHRYFKLLTEDRSIVIVRHDMENWEWELSFFQQAGVTEALGIRSLTPTQEISQGIGSKND